VSCASPIHGGFANVNKIVMAFYNKALDSDVISDFFEDIDMPALIDHQRNALSNVMVIPL